MLAKNPISAHAVNAWLATKDPRASYNWLSTDCLWAQYAKANGMMYAEVCQKFRETNGTRRFFGLFPRKGIHGSEPFEHLAMTGPHTYGAARKRLQQYL